MSINNSTRPKIAHFGAFDHDSYGDLIFPHIVEHFLPEFEFVHISPSGMPTKWNDAKNTISIDEAFKINDWSGVLVGGGDIVQDKEGFIWNDSNLQSLGALCSLWSGASLLSAELGIPCAWNSPGVPSELYNPLLSMAQDSIRCVDYLAVRDELSAKRIKRLLNHPLSIVPDTALVISEVFKNFYNNSNSKKALVLSLTPMDIEHRLNEIEFLIRQTIGDNRFSGKIVLLPLMGWQGSYTHTKIETLKLKFDLIIKDRSSTLQECALEISNGGCYVGNSLHGFVTALSYGVPAVHVNPMGFRNVTKYEGFVRHFSERNGMLADNFMEASKLMLSSRRVDIDKCVKSIKNHFNNIKQVLFMDRREKKNEWNRIMSVANSEAKNLLLHGYSSYQLVSNRNRKLNELNGQIASLNQTLSTKDQEIHNLNSTLTQRTEETEQQSKTIQSLNQTLTTKDQEIHNLNSALTQRTEETEQQSKTIETLNQTLTTKDQEIHNLNSTLTQRTEETEQQSKTIQSLNQTLTTKDQEIHNLNSTLTQRTEETEQQSKTIQSLNQTLTTKDQEIHNLNSALTQRTEETEQQSKTIETLNQTLTTKDQEIHNLNNLNHQNLTKYENIKKSNSFKITKPLRWLGRLLRGEFQLTLLPFKKQIKNLNFHRRVHEHYVSIIIVNYNGLSHLDSLFKSLYNQTYKKFEIIFVDNNSYDNSVNFVKTKYPDINIIINKKNLYFAEANNIGFEKSVGNLILLLNNDTELENNFLEKLVNKFNQNQDIVAVTPKILFFKKFFKLSLHFNKNANLDFKYLIDNLEYKKHFIKSDHSIKKDIIKIDKSELILWLPENEHIHLKFNSENITNKKLINYIKINNKIFNNFEIKDDFEFIIKKNFTINKNNKYIINNAGSSNYKNPYDVGFGEIDLDQYKNKEVSELVCGCAVLIDRYAIGHNKLFISEFKNYYEDSELSNRLAKKGKIAFENSAVVYHKHSATSVEHSFHWQYYVARNKILYDNLLFNETDIENKINNFLSNKIFKDLPKVRKKIFLDINNIIKNKKTLLTPNIKRIAIYNEYWNTLGGGEKRALDFVYELKLSDYCIDLISSSDFDIQNLKKYFNHSNLKLRKRIIDTQIQNISNEYDIFINSTYLSNLISYAKKSYFLLSFPQKETTKEFLHSYKFIPNSKYTLSWAKKYWKNSFDHKIIYPKFNFDPKKLGKIKKKKLILSVGRWTPLGHSKKQFEMAQMFNRLIKSKRYKEWSLVLAGSLNCKNSVEINYFNKVKNYLESNKLNSKLYFNLERDKLMKLFSEASVYWHFTGFNEDLKNKPELAEHFGMTLVEAIVHKCIPYVFNAGGQIEILECLKLNNKFSSFDELENKMHSITSFDNFEINQNFKKKFLKLSYYNKPKQV